VANPAMATVSELAQRDGVSKQAVAQAIRGMVTRHGLRVSRDSAGRVKGIDVAQFDAIRAATRHPSRDQRLAPQDSGAAQGSLALNETYDEALRLKTLYEAERSKLRLDTERGDLVPVVDALAAADALIDAVVSEFDKLPQVADEIAAAVARSGAAGARDVLKARARTARATLAAALDGMSIRKDDLAAV